MAETITISRNCPRCLEPNFIQVPMEGWQKWQADVLSVQDAFPDLTPDEREVLQTGYHAECWDLDFPDEDEEDLFDSLPSVDNSLYKELPPFTMENQLYRVIRWAGDSASPSGENSVEPTEDIREAHTISSEQPDGNHSLILDLDLPARLIPSTTPEHYHLYVDSSIPWDKYAALLDALADAGIIEPGYASVSKARGFTAVRLPWVRKEQ